MEWKTLQTAHVAAETMSLSLPKTSYHLAMLKTAPKSLLSIHYKFVLGTITKIIILLDFQYTLVP